MPLLLMLFAGAVTFIITLIQEYTLSERLVFFLLVLVIFYFLGSVLVWTLDYFDRQNEVKRENEGEVVEKEGIGESEQQSQDDGADPDRGEV